MAKPEGKYFKFNSEDDINPDFLETFTFDSPNQYIMTETDEFSAVCPFSGLPDMAYVKIEYFPKGGKGWEVLYSGVPERDYTYAEEIKHFCSSIESGEPPFISGENGLEAVLVIEAIRESNNKGNLAYR